LLAVDTDNFSRITFTYGGIKIDKEGHALTADNIRIPGLLVAGVDAGGFSNLGYAGGLALAFVTGFWAAKEVAKNLRLPLPELPPADPRDAASVPIKGRL
jgi:predicted oxidoreductase